MATDDNFVIYSHVISFVLHYHISRSPLVPALQQACYQLQASTQYMYYSADLSSRTGCGYQQTHHIRWIWYNHSWDHNSLTHRSFGKVAEFSPNNIFRVFVKSLFHILVTGTGKLKLRCDYIMKTTKIFHIGGLVPFKSQLRILSPTWTSRCLQTA